MQSFFQHTLLTFLACLMYIVRDQIEVWATKSGIVGKFFGDELYQEILGTNVCDATHVIAALAQFWEAVASMINQHTDQYSPLRWTAQSTSSKRENNPAHVNHQVQFVVFPNCHELYDYKTMFTFLAALEFSKDLCLHLGNRFTLTLFHPNFKNSCNLCSPERHSPFPVAGLEIKHSLTIPTSLRPPRQSVTPKRQRGNGVYRQKWGSYDGDDEDDDEKENHLVESRIRDLDERRDILEVLFNSPAVTGSGTDGVVPIAEYYPKIDSENAPLLQSPLSQSAEDEETDTLSLSFWKERQLRRRLFPRNQVIEMCQTWMKKSRFVDARGKEENLALQYTDALLESDTFWTISTHKIGELIYADLWKAICKLHEAGIQADEEAKQAKEAVTQAAEEAPSRSNVLFNQFDWMRSLGRSFQVPPVDRQSDFSPKQPIVVKSSAFVATKFCAFNAQSFKRFAITVNAALKRLAGGHMFIEGTAVIDLSLVAKLR